MERMRRNGNRMIKVNKKSLLTKIKQNKEAHIVAYDKAVIAYKREALKQITKITEQVEGGNLAIRLNLTTPIDNKENYDKIIEMFEWEIEEFVELEQNEFTEYVQDETEFAKQAMFSNTMYLGA